MKRLKVKSNPDLEKVIYSIEEYLDFFESDDYHEDSTSKYENAIFQFTMEALYGKEVWDWIAQS